MSKALNPLEVISRVSAAVQLANEGTDRGGVALRIVRRDNGACEFASFIGKVEEGNRTTFSKVVECRASFVLHPNADLKMVGVVDAVLGIRFAWALYGLTSDEDQLVACVAAVAMKDLTPDEAKEMLAENLHKERFDEFHTCVQGVGGPR
ncbi:MAG TPA: hypothetical protein VG984_03320 [Candidatus Paceibacterota bacterium]|nr:hypothetical protein [Candidatus Paceibacterota bacterium]